MALVSDRWRPLVTLLRPSAPLLLVLLLYLRFDGTPHFFLHTLTGWDLALTLLLLGTYRGYSWSRWDGLLPLALALLALTPDFIYLAGPVHRDWMDVFLFHIALDEILTIALIVLTLLWLVLARGYLQFRVVGPLAARQRGQLRRLLVGSAIVLAGLIASGLVVERTTRTPLIRVGQQAPDFALDSTDGGTVSLSEARGQPVVLAFVPSVLCDFCRQQLRALQEALPELRARGMALYAISTDEGAVQGAAVERLGLDYAILAEAPTVGQHPAGSAYGVYHLRQPHPGPVHANGIVVVDSGGTVRAVRVQPGQAMTAAEILGLVKGALG